MKHLLLILALSATVMLTGLGGSRLWDDDEPRNAGCAREMLARGDWIVPWFNNELRAHKPVLTYWCMMLSYLALGDSEFSARFPSALAAIGTTLLTYAIGRRLFSPQAALWAALILPTTMLFALAGRIATPDSLLIFCVTLTMAMYVWTAWPKADAGENHETHKGHVKKTSETTPYFPRAWGQATAVYAAMGLAVLAKGPVGMVLPTAIIGMLLLVVRWRSRILTRSVSEGFLPFSPRLRFGFVWLARISAHFIATAWSMRPLTALAVVALVAGPWYLAVGYRTDWQFLEEFFIKHNVERATGAMEGHRGGIWFYPAMLLIGFFPWSSFAIPLGLDTFATMKRPSRERTAQLFLLCWIGVWLGAFTIARTKLPSYATPCFPAIALLTGHFIERLLASNVAIGRYWPAVSFGCLAAAGIGTCIAIPLVAERYLPGEQWLGILGIAPLGGGVGGLALWSQSRLRPAMAGLVLSAAVLVLGVFGLGAHVASRHQQADKLLAAAAAASDAPEMASFKILEPSWIYYGRQPIREIHGPRTAAIDFLAASPDRFLITTEKRWQVMSRERRGEELTVLAEADYFLEGERLVLVGRPCPRMASRPSPTRQSPP
ncbi:MAG: glycosyltransferase family 39 protein [Pirellulaceae bacterium]